MPYIRVGQCNHCGLCCVPPVIIENPCIESGEYRCKFYTDTANAKLYGHCLIYGRGNKPIQQSRDRFGNKITESQITWFNQNCIDYPTLDDMEAGHIPPIGCGFTIQVVS